MIGNARFDFIHFMHYTALPDWAQTLGMTFSVILWMPSGVA